LRHVVAVVDVVDDDAVAVAAVLMTKRNWMKKKLLPLA
jgi:hypothetical protein